VTSCRHVGTTDGVYNRIMAKLPQEILDAALSLPPEAPAALADSLLGSLDREVDEDAEEAWRLEIRRRIGELDAGEVRTIPWVEVRARLIRLLGK